MASSGTITALRNEYHSRLLAEVWGYKGPGGPPSNADVGSKISKANAAAMLANKKSPTTSPKQNQSAGKVFGEITRWFVEASFRLVEHVRPGPWRFSTEGSRKISDFDQYRHLAELQRFLEQLEKTNKESRTAFDYDYLVTPDILVWREPLADIALNEKGAFLEKGDRVAKLAPLRASNKDSGPILHASISCKWTLRSDRAQNARTEALNLLRNRKGNTPHIVVVTAEPELNRLASLALGTGDIDCVYHMALNELEEAVNSVGNESQIDMLSTLVLGRRLRDISDLPIDLAI
jgi:hypothetical protein